MVIHMPACTAEHLVYVLRCAKFVDLPSYPEWKTVHKDFIDPSSDAYTPEKKEKKIETNELHREKETSVIPVKRKRGRPKKEELKES
jgi:hypothetical protein